MRKVSQHRAPGSGARRPAGGTSAARAVGAASRIPRSPAGPRQLAPPPPPPRHPGELLTRALALRYAQLVAVHAGLDTGHERRWASPGRGQPFCQDRCHTRRVDLGLTQPKGAQVFATLPTIFARLARRLPMGPAHAWSSCLPRQAGLGGCIPSQP